MSVSDRAMKLWIRAGWQSGLILLVAAAMAMMANLLRQERQVLQWLKEAGSDLR